MKINAKNTNTNFTSVIPVRVIANGQEVHDSETLRKGCNAVIKEIAGPVKNCKNQQVRSAAAILSTMDPHYNYFLAYTNGYKSLSENAINSDYFKTIIGKENAYIVTGPAARELKEIGHEIGRAKKECNFMNTNTSPRLIRAQDTYQRAIYNIASDKSQRIREIFDRHTAKKIGEEQEMVINISTKIVRSNGKNAVQVNSIDGIKFQNK